MTPGSVLSSLKGSVELAQFDEAALKRFDLSYDGFWRSFTVVLIMVPLFLLVLYLQNTFELRSERAPDSYSIALLIFLVEWACFSLIMVPITKFLGVWENYAPAMTVYNWCRPIAFAFFLPVNAAGAAGLAGQGTVLFLFSLAITLRSIYLGYVLHLTLKVNLGAILAILLLDSVLGIFMSVLLPKLIFT